MESNNLLIPLSISCFSAVQLIFSLSTLLTFSMTLQSHPNSSPQRQWLWRWELTVTGFCPFSLQTVLSRFSSTEGCPADASGQTAVQSRHVSSSTGDLEAGQYYKLFLFCPPPSLTPKLSCVPLFLLWLYLMPLDTPHCFFHQWCYPRLQLSVVGGHCCSEF